MNVVPSTVALISLPLAVCLAMLIARYLLADALVVGITGRHRAIDGLRGYMAFFVYLHHGAIWYDFLRAGRWAAPESHLINHLGQSSVAIFFMITGYLFSRKLLNARVRPIDWLELASSRVFRLMPLYLFAMLLMFMIVGQLSGWRLRQGGFTVLRQALVWLSGGIGGEPRLNEVRETGLILAGVVWSLRYEWTFYGLLPALCLLLRLRPPLTAMLVSVVAIVWATRWQAQAVHFLTFLGGIAAAVLERQGAVVRLARRSVLGGVAVAAVALAVTVSPTAQEPLPLLLLGLAFCIIALGNSIFGLMTLAGARALGEVSYSIYMLHGILLYSFFTFVVGRDAASSWTPLQHWAALLSLVPILVGISVLTFRLIEAPAMLKVRPAARWLRQLGRRSGKPA